MTQFTLKQLSAALSALGVSVPTMDAATSPDVRTNASADIAAATARFRTSGGQSIPATARVPSAPNLSGHSAHVCPAASVPAPAVHPAQAPTAPAPGPSQPTPLAATGGPDGPWYVVSKGRAMGVYRGWQNVSNLVTGIGTACFFHHGTRATAEATFNEALAAGAVEIL
ncbi:uncharacterized protein EV420DRAFT_1487663 [Desarmillaria tabescens]|uniref:Ribonuclease H1 N-terminal domain-containing protein n=1 Tax=Armillaria tabescens TaxID=1929756 RepID=A0AA39MJT9_ARMTA|nr:uncharacterized protein EV420DRAFT_1487663 [Desarmillaria tabescens]KAK0436070.1 hypothetical protein EV420DRAFT_1487663 [Desarmillaria tabescens]